MSMVLRFNVSNPRNCQWLHIELGCRHAILSLRACSIGSVCCSCPLGGRPVPEPSTSGFCAPRNRTRKHGGKERRRLMSTTGLETRALVLPLMTARPSFSAGLVVVAVATVIGADAHGDGSASMSCGHIRNFYQAQDCCSEGEEPLSVDFSTSEGTSFSSSVCGASSPVVVCHCAGAMQLLSQVPGVQFLTEFCAHMTDVKPVGSHDQPICEASIPRGWQGWQHQLPPWKHQGAGHGGRGGPTDRIHAHRQVVYVCAGF